MPDSSEFERHRAKTGLAAIEGQFTDHASCVQFVRALEESNLIVHDPRAQVGAMANAAQVHMFELHIGARAAGSHDVDCPLAQQGE